MFINSHLFSVALLQLHESGGVSTKFHEVGVETKGYYICTLNRKYVISLRACYLLESQESHSNITQFMRY